MPLLDVRADHLKIVQDILKKFVPEHEVWAFGSRAKWLAKEYSDLDLCILGETPLSFRTLGLLEEAFEESDLPYKVDVVDWATTSESFRKIIERDNVVVQEGGRGWVMTHKKVAEFAARTAIGPFGSRMKSDTYTASGVPVIRGTNLTGGKYFSGDWVFVSEQTADELSNCCVYPGDLVFPHRGAIGEVGLVPDYFPRYVMSSSLMTLSCDLSEANPNYVYYFFKSNAGRHELLKNASQVGTPGIGQPLSTLRSIEVPLPPLREQERIGKILSDLDDKIYLNCRINQTLEAMAQAIFKSWFVDFAPVNAKIAAKQEGRDSLRAAMSAISGKPDAELDALPREYYDQLAATAALFPDEMEASELGEIPRGWVPADISTVCDLNTSSWSTKTLPMSVQYVDLANTKNGEIIEVQLMEGASIPSRARRILEPGDTIVGTVRPGNRSFALVGETGLTGSTGFAVLHPKKDFLREYIYLTATTDENIERLAHLADGGAYPAVRPELVVSKLLPIPDESLLREFHRVSSKIFDQVLANRRTNQELADLRDTLLPKLLSGELSVNAVPNLAFSAETG